MKELKLLGERIRELRRARGLSQEALAERIETGAKYVSALERGQKNPTASMLIKVARGLRVELVDLCNHSWLTLTESELKKKLLAMIERASAEQLREFLCLLKTREL